MPTGYKFQCFACQLLIFSQIGDHWILVLNPGLRETTLSSFTEFFSSIAIKSLWLILTSPRFSFSIEAGGESHFAGGCNTSAHLSAKGANLTAQLCLVTGNWALYRLQKLSVTGQKAKPCRPRNLGVKSKQNIILYKMTKLILSFHLCKGSTDKELKSGLMIFGYNWLQYFSYCSNWLVCWVTLIIFISFLNYKISIDSQC